MPGASLTAPAVGRRGLRRVAAMLVLAFLLAMGGSQCSDAMGGGPHPAHAASSATMVDTDQAGRHTDHPGGDAGGVLALCLALLFVVAAAAGLRPSGPRIVRVLRPRWRGRLPSGVTARAPSLAHLCVLRA